MRLFLKRLRARFIGWLVTFEKKHKRLKIALEALVVGLPPAVLAYANIKWGDKPIAGQGTIRAVLAGSPELLVAVLAWPMVGNVLIGLWSDWVKGLSDGGSVRAEELVALITAIDDVEGKKMNRFADFARQVETEKTLAPKAFLTITRPDKQIEHIVTNLHHALTVAMSDDTLKLVLARVENGVPVQWRCQVPNDVLLPDDLLAVKARNTLFAEAARTRQPQVINDIEKHLAKKGKKTRYVATGDPNQDVGSIFCKPLYSPQLQRVLYVLSIKSDKHLIINDGFGRRHGPLLKSFCNLLLMEAHLEVIRAHVEANNESH